MPFWKWVENISQQGRLHLQKLTMYFCNDYPFKCEYPHRYCRTRVIVGRDEIVINRSKQNNIFYTTRADK